MRTSFAEAVRTARERLGLTSRDVADLVGKHPSYIRRMEMTSTNRIVPNAKERVWEVAVALEEDPEVLWHLAMGDRISMRDPDIYETLVALGVFE